MGDDHEGYIRETVGVFEDKQHLKAAVDELGSAGFPKNELGLLAHEQTVLAKLGDYYAKVNKTQQVNHSREVAFVNNETDRDTAGLLSEGLYFVGGTTAAGAVVASTAVLAGPVAVAIASVLAVGAIGAIAGTMINKSDVHYLRDKVDQGYILLLVRHTDSEQEAQAKDILSRNGALDTRVYDVPKATESTEVDQTGKNP